jgi:uncharacterized protein YjiS (DUF1127 family)
VEQQGGALTGAFGGACGPARGIRTQRGMNVSRRRQSSHAARHRAARALYWVASIARASARGLYIAAGRVDAWLERRRVAAAALRDFRTMSERELRDIGLTRVDVHRVAWGASHR